jgi:hypothetical protein
MPLDELCDVGTGWNNFAPRRTGVGQGCSHQLLSNATSAQFGRDERVGEGHPGAEHLIFAHRQMAIYESLIAAFVSVVANWNRRGYHLAETLAATLFRIKPSSSRPSIFINQSKVP